MLTMHVGHLRAVGAHIAGGPNPDETATMHPFWLTFKNGGLERRFQSEQNEARLPTDKICILSLFAYELAIQYRYSCFDDVWPVAFLLRLVIYVAPLSVFLWCHLTLKRRDLLAVQPMLSLGVKVMHAPVVSFLLEYASFPDKAAIQYGEEYETRPILGAFGFVLALGITGAFIPLMFTTMGIRVGFKRQFYILLVGLPCRFWWTRKEITRLCNLHPSGIQRMNGLSAAIDTYANVVLHFTHSSSQHQAPSPYRSEQVVAFLNFFGIGIACQAWLWWCELLDRERFLKRLVSNRPHDNDVKALVYKESRMLRSGLDVNGWGVHPCFLITSFVVMSCVGAIAWKSIALFFDLFSYCQGQINAVEFSSL
ncbi:hypothetical protein BSKO_10060 [Bryopsis sp. KO-2023]|nr:hypothetical protein BSKO_10060 [Bryopsis sp. KO-2023]